MERMQAGPELDAEVSRRVFGVPWTLHSYCVINGRRKDVPTWVYDEDWCSPDDPPGGWTWGMTPPAYSRDDGLAMRVFEALVEMMGTGSIHADMEDARGEGFVVSVSIGCDEQAVTASGPLPLAICRAALAAVSDGEAPR